jgi:hypothetical protein
MPHTGAHRAMADQYEATRIAGTNPVRIAERT